MHEEGQVGPGAVRLGDLLDHIEGRVQGLGVPGLRENGRLQVWLHGMRARTVRGRRQGLAGRARVCREIESRSALL